MTGHPPSWRRWAYQARRWWREERAARAATIHPHPIFVLGMQKSGTSAVASLLGIRSGLAATIDLPRDWRRTTVHRVGDDPRAFARFVRRHAAGFARPIVKEPNLTFLVDHLRRRWPASPLIFVIRDPAETIRSILDRLELPGDVDRFPAEGLRKIPSAWRVVLDNRWIGVDSSHPIESLAGRWRRAAEIALETPEAIRVRYEDFLSDKTGTIDGLVSRLGLHIHADMDADLDRPFQPPGRPRPVDRVFGSNLERIHDIAGPIASALGYPS